MSGVRPESRVPWLRGVLLWLVLVLYITTFWGRFGPQWPGWVRAHTGRLARAAWQVYLHATIDEGALARVRDQCTVEEKRAVWAASSMFFGGFVPLGAVLICWRRPRDVGLGWPNRWGWRVVIIGALVTVPFAYAFAGERMDGPAAALQRLSWWVQLVLVAGVSVPEHFLLTGVGVAGLLPNGRFPTHRPLATVDGGPGKRILRWLGLAQPAEPGLSLGGRFLAWWGLDGPALVAIIGGGLLFGLVHVGAQPIEFATSFPGGVAVCYVTYRSGSIWPAWLIHMGQMVWVTVFLVVRGGG